MRIAISFAGVILLAVGASQAKGLAAANVSRYIGNSKWAWTVFLTGPKTILKEVDHVEYEISDPPTPTQTVNTTSNPHYPFGLEGTSSSGTVEEINIKVFLKNQRILSMKHVLRFAGGPCMPIITVSRQRLVRLTDPRFKHDVYVYVDEIPNDWRKHPPTLTVLYGYGFASAWNYDLDGQGPFLHPMDFASQTKWVPPTTKWSLSVRKEGDAISFRYSTATYLLTVKKVSLGVLANQLNIEICEAPSL